MFSVMEAIHSETVMVGIPLATDQFANMARAVRNNIAKQLRWDSLTTASLVSTIKSAMKDKTMSRYNKFYYLFIICIVVNQNDFKSQFKISNTNISLKKIFF